MLITRSLESRVGVVAPFEDVKLREELRLILYVQLSSKKHVCEMQADGNYIERLNPLDTTTLLSSQDTFISLAQKRKKAAAKHRQSRLREKLLTYFRKRVSDEQ